ncbi:MAG: NnrS family protein [Gammaproteobacteria bacterium]|nr:NnrS family protein [Gammaproteobacteria bacterium]NNJ85310.1 NnrS family protein [Gammaproteobacteria bacterium]
MLKIHVESPQSVVKPAGIPFLALGFRPFFLLAGLFGVILILLWLGIWSGGIKAPLYYNPVTWHTHEMLYGYTAAVIAGFLLTAVRNWTGAKTPDGIPLALLAMLWLAGRILPFFSAWIPGVLIAIVDIAFLPLLAMAIQPALWKGKASANRIFVPLLFVMAVPNLMIHLESLGLVVIPGSSQDIMLYLVIFLVALLGGRIIPFFSESAIPGHRCRRYPTVEMASVTLLACLILAQVIVPATLSAGWLTGVLALAAAAVQLVRLWGWHHIDVWQKPILWVLYTGFLWLVVGLFLLGLASFAIVPSSLAKHALTIGVIGTLTLGMMARVALAHTGRPLKPAWPIVAAFVAINVAALIRVFGPLLLAESYAFHIHLSGGIWFLAFAVFLVVYLPILIRPRIDGKAW